MPDHALAAAPWWRRVLTLEPAVVRGVIGAVVLVLGLWGVDAADLGDRVTESLVTLLGLVPLIVAAWTRTAVTPSAQVLVKQRADGELTPGDASPIPNDVTIRGDVPVGDLVEDRIR